MNRARLGATMAMVLTVFFVILSLVPAMAAEERATEYLPSELPWVLREHFMITRGEIEFVCAGDSGEWKLQTTGGDALIESATAHVVLSDGTVIDPMLVGQGRSRIGRFEDEFDEGRDYSVEMPPAEGVVLTHSLEAHSSRAFFLIRLKVTNQREEPIEIARIVSASFHVSDPNGTVSVGRRNLLVRGPYPVLTDLPGCLLAFFQDPQRHLNLGVGMLPMRVTVPRVTTTFENEGWQTTVVGTFDPPIRLNPGESIEGDPIWLSHGVPGPGDIDLLYSWTHSRLPQSDLGEKMPVAWVTTPDGGSDRDLYELAEAWGEAGVDHALVPASWETAPGSLVGAGPRYPRDIGSVAATLRARGVHPGITVDPLASQGAAGEWAVKSVDGQQWINPSVAAARAYASQRLATLVQSGFEFFVIEPSGIPDEVLSHFNLTRMQADAYAFRIMAEGAPGLPVLPAAYSRLAPKADPWLEASACTSRLREYGVVSGPACLDVSALKAVDNELLTAMAFYGGPIELRNSCSASLRAAFTPVFSRSHVAARTLTAQAAPKLWHVLVQPGDGSDRREAIVTFAGASASDGGAHDMPAVTSVWDAAGGELLRIAALPVRRKPSQRSGRNKAPLFDQEVDQRPSSASDSSVASAVPEPGLPTDEASSAPDAELARADAVLPVASDAQPVDAALEDGPPLVPKEETAEDAPLPTEEKTHVVGRGDTLSRLARTYSVTIRDIQAWNGLQSDKILIGQELKICLPAEPVQETSVEEVIVAEAAQTAEPSGAPAEIADNPDEPATDQRADRPGFLRRIRRALRLGGAD